MPRRSWGRVTSTESRPRDTSELPANHANHRKNETCDLRSPIDSGEPQRFCIPVRSAVSRTKIALKNFNVGEI